MRGCSRRRMNTSAWWCAGIDFAPLQPGPRGAAGPAFIVSRPPHPFSRSPPPPIINPARLHPTAPTRTVMYRTLLAAFPLLTCYALLALAQPGAQPPGARPPTPPRPAPVLPGVEAGGTIRLHNQWALRPAGRQLELGD